MPLVIRNLRYLVMIVVALLVWAPLAGCSSRAPSMAPASSEGEFAPLIDHAIARAHEAGADQTQIGFLEQARADGVLSPQTAQAAAQLFAECAESFGIRVELVPFETSTSYPRIDYRVYADDPTVADGCYEAFYAYVDQVYQVQPAAVQAQREAVLAKSAQLETCVHEHGLTLPHHPTYDELRLALLTLLYGFDPSDPHADPAAAKPSVDCLSPAGLDPNDL